LIDFLSFHDLWTWNRDSTQKHKHLFPVWYLLWNGCSYFLPHHLQGSSTERWSRNTLRVVTAGVFYVLRGFLTSLFILNNSMETAAPFNVVSQNSAYFISDCFLCEMTNLISYSTNVSIICIHVDDLFMGRQKTLVVVDVSYWIWAGLMNPKTVLVYTVRKHKVATSPCSCHVI